MYVYVLVRVNCHSERDTLGVYKTEQRAVMAMNKDFKEYFGDDLSLDQGDSDHYDVKVYEVYYNNDLSHFGEFYSITKMELK